MSHAPLIFDQSMDQLEDVLESWGEPSYRSRQVWHAIYDELLDDPRQISTLPSELRPRLANSFAFSSLEPVASARSSDGETEKVLFSLPQGGSVEAVLMRYESRRTACISTQVGCAMGCVFCATGQMGFVGNLSPGQIIEQVLYFGRKLAQQGDKLSNVVVMGMGEPFHNYEATLEALDRLNDPQGFNFGARRFTISTVGLVPLIERFTEEARPYNLAVSLHAATDELRASMLPINQRYPLDSLMSACRSYVQRSGRRITFEWALVRDVNDGLDQARRLADWLKGMTCHVNLIPLNPTQGYAGQASSMERAIAFRDDLRQSGIACTIRVRRGIDIQAGCGQLATEAARQAG